MSLPYTSLLPHNSFIFAGLSVSSPLLVFKPVVSLLSIFVWGVHSGQEVGVKVIFLACVRDSMNESPGKAEDILLGLWGDGYGRNEDAFGF